MDNYKDKIYSRKEKVEIERLLVPVEFQERKSKTIVNFEKVTALPSSGRFLLPISKGAEATKVPDMMA